MAVIAAVKIETKHNETHGGSMAVVENELVSMSVSDLWSLHERTSRILAVRIISGMCELEKGVSILNRKGHIKGANGLQRFRTRRKYPKVLPKYRNPFVPSETWSGRGRQPRWLVAAVKAGRTIEDFKISYTNGSDLMEKRA